MKVPFERIPDGFGRRVARGPAGYYGPEVNARDVATACSGERGAQRVPTDHSVGTVARGHVSSRRAAGHGGSQAAKVSRQLPAANGASGSSRREARHRLADRYGVSMPSGWNAARARDLSIRTVLSAGADAATCARSTTSRFTDGAISARPTAAASALPTDAHPGEFAGCCRVSARRWRRLSSS